MANRPASSRCIVVRLLGMDSVADTGLVLDKDLVPDTDSALDTDLDNVDKVNCMQHDSSNWAIGKCPPVVH